MVKQSNGLYHRRGVGTIPAPRSQPTFEQLLEKAKAKIEGERSAMQSRSEWMAKYWQDITPEKYIEQRIREWRRENDGKWRATYRFRWESVEKLLYERGHRYLRCRWQNYEAETKEQIAVFNGIRKWCETAKQRIANGENLLLIGACGTGKDHLLACILRDVVMRSGLGAEWTTGPRMFARWRAEFDRNDEETSDPGETPVWSKRYRGLKPILAISDPVAPGGTLTPYQTERLFAILDKRSSHGASTFVTINAASRADLEQRLGVAIVDRLRDQATPFAFTWESFRKTIPML